jgi:large subunit ribosomal protein L32
MAVPKRKTSPSRRNQRRAHDALKGINITFDKDSGEAKLSHHICAGGFYNGKLVKAKKVKNQASEGPEAPAA